jgi:hypothetical protein
MKKDTDNSKSKTAYLLPSLFVLVLVAISFTGCPNDTVSGNPPAPGAEETVAVKTSPVQKSVDFTLTGGRDGTWTVYRSADALSGMKTVSAVFNDPILTLTASGDDLTPGTYYVTVTEPDMPESGRLALTVNGYVSDGSSSITAKDDSTPMLHRGALHTPEDFERIRLMVNLNQEPWLSGSNKLTANSHAQLAYQPKATGKIIRGGESTEEPESDNYGTASDNAAAAYQLALRWKISQDPGYAVKAVEILNLWADTCTSITGDTNRSLAAGFSGFQFAVAGELLRGFSGWEAVDFGDYKKWMLEVFYSQNKDFLDRHHDTRDDHYWANWDLCNLASVIAIGILTDRRDIYNYAIAYLQNGTGNGRLTKAINNLHTTEDGEELGQIQESGRDQGHTTLVIALIGTICQLTWNQGDDFYGYDNNRFLKGCEYVAKYNIANLDVPFTAYTREYGNKQSAAQTETHTAVSTEGRGTVRPIWALPYYHYTKIKGLDESKVKYTKMGMDALSPEGGGGDYGSGGGFDQLGFGGLMYAR